MDSTPPPRYSSPSPAPRYTQEPSSMECRFFSAVRYQPSAPQGIYAKNTRGFTLRLYNQEPNTRVPTYVRNAVITGDVQISEHEVELVTAKLEGKQTLSSGDGGSGKHVMFSVSHTLWRQQGDTKCPSVLDLSVPFPPSYMDQQGILEVPPTFEASFHDKPGLYASVEYVLSVTVTKTRFGSWKQAHSVSVPLQYQPKSRPYLPITQGPFPFLNAIKIAPEEWYQINSTIRSQQDATAPIDVLLFIPEVRIYALTDTIPFHLQLKGPPASLREFMHTGDTFSQLSQQTSRCSTTSSLLSSPALQWASTQDPTSYATLPPHPMFLPANDKKNPTIRVYFLRQVSVTLNGKKYWRNLVIGEGKLSSVDEPPQWPFFESENGALNWEGEIRCNENVKVGSFLASGLHIKDFIVIHVCPSFTERSMFKEHMHPHPIRLVTDPYRDVFRHPSDL